jgi:hypothetical protein
VVQQHVVGVFNQNQIIRGVIRVVEIGVMHVKPVFQLLHQPFLRTVWMSGQPGTMMWLHLHPLI